MAASDGSVLVLQCDPLASSLRRLEHAKFICENARAKYIPNIEIVGHETKVSTQKISDNGVEESKAKPIKTETIAVELGEEIEKRYDAITEGKIDLEGLSQEQ